MDGSTPKEKPKYKIKCLDKDTHTGNIYLFRTAKDEYEAQLLQIYLQSLDQPDFLFSIERIQYAKKL